MQRTLTSRLGSLLMEYSTFFLLDKGKAFFFSHAELLWEVYGAVFLNPSGRLVVTPSLLLPEPEKE